MARFQQQCSFLNPSPISNIWPGKPSSSQLPMGNTGRLYQISHIRIILCHVCTQNLNETVCGISIMGQVIGYDINIITKYGIIMTEYYKITVYCDLIPCKMGGLFNSQEGLQDDQQVSNDVNVNGLTSIFL